jgi:hypothetical protein
VLRRLGWPCVLVCLGLLAAQEADGTPALWGELRAGRHAVGYRVLGDSSLTVHVWYPAKGGGEPLTYGAYLGAEQPRGFAAVLFPDIARVTQATGETDRGVVAMAKKTRAFLDRELR